MSCGAYDASRGRWHTNASKKTRGRGDAPSGNAYERHIKRVLDVALSYAGLVLLSPFYALIAAAIVIDDPGPVLFRQKRVGRGGRIFTLHKFRTMGMDAPHDVPTHLLEDPERYITRVGRILRKYSLDELPQLFDILVGELSIVGPRPALWNQDDLVAERERYGANDLRPGLTGWAQINGRDELEIAEKARLDGEYVARLKKGSASGFLMDVRCVLGTATAVLRHDGVVEGGTGEMKRKGAGRE